MNTRNKICRKPARPVNHSLTPLRSINCEAVFHALAGRERLTRESLQIISAVCGMTPQQVEQAINDLTQAGRIKLETRGAHRYASRVTVQEEVTA
jgi:hypothetical protein